MALVKATPCQPLQGCPPVPHFAKGTTCVWAHAGRPPSPPPQVGLLLVDPVGVLHVDIIPMWDDESSYSRPVWVRGELMWATLRAPRCPVSRGSRKFGSPFFLYGDIRGLPKPQRNRGWDGYWGERGGMWAHVWFYVCCPSPRYGRLEYSCPCAPRQITAAICALQKRWRGVCINFTT